MGNSVTKAKDLASEEQDKVNGLMSTLANKLETFELEMKATRGSDGITNKEVGGGRTIMHMSEIRVADDSGPAKQLVAGITNFFNAAESHAVDGDDTAAKSSAIEGAKNLLIGGLDALFGVSSGQGMEKKSFVVLYLNNAFVRVDYAVYTYSVSALAWGAEANTSGACYVADLSVLPMHTLLPDEIDFLISQALFVPNGAYNQLMKLKILLTEVSILGRMMVSDTITFDELGDVIKELGGLQEDIEEAFASLNASASHEIEKNRREAEALKSSTTRYIRLEKKKKKKVDKASASINHLDRRLRSEKVFDNDYSLNVHQEQGSDAIFHVGSSPELLQEQVLLPTDRKLGFSIHDAYGGVLIFLISTLISAVFIFKKKRPLSQRNETSVL